MATPATRQTYRDAYDDALYWEEVDRNLDGIGDSQLPRPATNVVLASPAASASSALSVLDETLLDTGHDQGAVVKAAHRLYEHLVGLWAPGVIEAAFDLGAYPHLARAPMTSVSLAAAIGADARATRILLDGLYAYRIVERADDADGVRRYRLRKEYAPCLLSGGLYSLTGKMIYDRRVAWPAWQHLARAVRTGTVSETGAEAQNQISEDEYESLVGGINFWAPPVVEILLRGIADLGWDLTRPASVLDVGCGTGLYSHLLLDALPAWTATGLEAPSIAALARNQADRLGVAARFTCREADFLTDDWDTGHDLVLFANIFHLQPPEIANRLVHSAAVSLAPAGLVCVVDQIYDENRTVDSPQDRFAALFAVSMLATGGGDAHSIADYDSWLSAAGLRRAAVLQTPMHRILLASHIDTASREVATASGDLQRSGADPMED